MNVFVNDTPREVPPETTVAMLLAEINVTQRHVAVEINLELVPRARHGERWLREDDRVEVVTLVGGG